MNLLRRTRIPWKYLIGWYILAMMLALQLTSCGTRKSAVTIEKSKEQSSESIRESGSTKEESVSETKEVVKDSVKKKTEVASTKVTEEFGEDGKVKKRTTETVNKTKTDNSTKTQEKSGREAKTKLNTYNRFIDTHRTITTKNKIKDVDRSNTLVENFGGKGTIIWSVLIIGLIVAAYFAVKNGLFIKKPPKV